MKFLKSLIIIGFTILAVGILYESAFVNIPPQDPPNEIIEKYNTRHTIAITIMLVGVCCTVIGVLLRLGKSKKVDETY